MMEETDRFCVGFVPAPGVGALGGPNHARCMAKTTKSREFHGRNFRACDEHEAELEERIKIEKHYTFWGRLKSRLAVIFGR